MSPSPKGYSHGPYGTPPKTMQVWVPFKDGKPRHWAGTIYAFVAQDIAEQVYEDVRPVTLVWEDQK